MGRSPGGSDGLDSGAVRSLVGVEKGSAMLGLCVRISSAAEMAGVGDPSAVRELLFQILC